MTRDLPPVHLRGELGRALAEELARSEMWERPRRGAYAPTPTGPAWKQREQRALARTVAVGRQLGDAVASDLSAALLHRLQVWHTPETPSVILPYNPRAGMVRNVRRRACALDDSDVVEIDGVRVTSLERTMLDCAASLHPRDALVVVDSGFRTIILPERRDRRADVEERTAQLRRELLARVASGSRGAVQARMILEAANPLAERAPESVIRWIVLGRGMLAPTLQKEVVTSRGTFYSDLAWEIVRAGRSSWYHVEFDGTGKYEDDPQGRSTAQVLLDERKRESAITDTGDKVVRVYSDEIDDEDGVFRKITAPLSRATLARCRPVPGLYRPPRR